MNVVCKSIAPLAILAALGACTVGPDYVRPVADAPAKFKEADG